MRLIARYAKEAGEDFEVISVFDNEIKREIISRSCPNITTLAKVHPVAIWFERKITDDFGILVEDAFDKRKLVHHERFPAALFPMRKSFQKKHITFDDYTPYKYEAITGDGVFQVAVGPIHAGIIEPGHFQFSQAGEQILHLEVRHFYKYRAIEKMLEGKTIFEAKSIIERISGIESIAYQIAWRDILLKATTTPLPLPLMKQHALLLEIERIIHHLTDIGFIPNDAGFGAALAYASTMAEDARRILKAVTGHRFGFGAIAFERFAFNRSQVHRWLDKLEEQIHFFESWIRGIPSLWERLDTTGILKQFKAKKYDTVGVVARASGLAEDQRQNEFYREFGFTLITEQTGDVAARFKVRIGEIKNSIELIRNFMDEAKVDVDINININDINDGEYMSFAESSIGEIFMSVDIKDGVIDRFYVRDPSFVNWQALHLMMSGNIIADFPLINKSCDLSYAGNDL